MNNKPLIEYNNYSIFYKQNINNKLKNLFNIQEIH